MQQSDTIPQVDHAAATRSMVTEGNRLRLLVQGDETLEAMTGAIERACQRVWLETFILRTDAPGQQVLAALEDAARRDCNVAIVVDNMASLTFSLRQYDTLRQAGGQVLLYNPLPPWRHIGRRMRSLLYRDHRKILIADDVGFCGGHNITEKYIGPEKPAFYDTTLQLEGPCVRDLGRVFQQSVAQTGIAQLAPLPEPAPLDGGVRVAVKIVDRKHGIDSASQTLKDLLRRSRSRCYLTIAYFVPERWLIDELIATATRGVDVRIIAAGETDQLVARAAGRHLYGELLRGGVRVYEFYGQQLHAKNVTVDAKALLLGTFDFNRLSARYSLEVAVSARDPAIAAQLEREFCVNIVRSREVRLEEWLRRGLLTRTVQGTAMKLFNQGHNRITG